MTVSTRLRRSKSLPRWLKRRIPLIEECSAVESVIRRNNLHTVCREALCPNRAECYSRRKVTFIILGDVCTRGCLFCSVSRGTPLPPDLREPERCAHAASELGLRHVIVTSVTRDDLPDGGAAQFAASIRALRVLPEDPAVEVLVPDFGGRRDSLAAVLAAAPDILSHNIETVRRLYPALRRGADFDRSLQLLSEAKLMRKEVMTKSALILGLGETMEEVRDTFRDLRRCGCDFLAVGQYLRPGLAQVSVREYLPPERFEEIREEALGMGFREVAAGPLVRSSYHENRLDRRIGADPC
jgi:lipoic acid synthetase